MCERLRCIVSYIEAICEERNKLSDGTVIISLYKRVQYSCYLQDVQIIRSAV